jgi:hypothetical protein
MKAFKIFLALILIVSSNLIFGQTINPFMDDYKFYESVHAEKTIDYQGIDGSPYLSKEFVEGEFRLKDTNTVKLPIRYNIYSDAMEYKLIEETLAVGNPKLLDKVILGESVFVYLPFIEKGGYFEIFESGKCFLAQKRVIKYKEAEAAKPIEGVSKPARFITEADVFYLVLNQSNAVRISNMKSVVSGLQDQKPKIESFIDQEKIKNTKKENLIKIVKYYNSL